MSTTSSTKDAVVGAPFPRKAKKGAVLWMPWSQTVLVAVFAMLGVLAVVRGHLGLWVLSWIVMIAVAVPIDNMPGYAKVWIFLIGLWRSARGQSEGVARPATAEEIAADREAEAAAVAAGVEPPARLRLSGEAGEIRLFTMASGQCMVWDPVHRNATVIARVHGTGFTMAEPEDQADVLDSWAAAINALADHTGVVAVQASDVMTVLSAAQVREAYIRQVEESEIASGAALSPMLHEDILQTLSGDRAQTHNEGLVSITVHQGLVKEDVKEHGGGVAGLMELMEAEMTEFERLLSEASVTVTSWLTTDALALVIRTAFSPFEANDLATGMVKVSAATAGPMAAKASWDKIRCEGTWHRVMRVDLPTRTVKAGFMRRLNEAGDFPHVVTQTFHSEGIAAGLARAEAENRDDLSADQMRAWAGRVKGLEEQAMSNEIVDHGDHALAGYGDVKFLTMVVVSAESEDELELNTKQMISGARRAGCEVRTFYGQQWPAFLAAALPFGRGLQDRR
ncbi:hypothetical protein FCK90_10525 [Kocuria coralli]|uniref:PrgI family protein n=1 Tax=Kocuria coralli TaxID=1461025 RepID=A0A5J5KVX9_9MICC|nr:SCO6880 family protein [Kocuria coralli]KAA9393839.1 hypothetical protein FCK90_10525 [Kocuria coralli]